MLPAFVFKFKIDNHKELNENLLSLINLIPHNPYENKKDSTIAHTDWNLPKEVERKYGYLFFNKINPYLQELTSNLNCNHCKVENYWFQQYEKGSSHNWHNHNNCHFAGVYFVECPNNYGTVFKNFEVDCTEGDLLIFPSFLIHTSKEIVEDIRKTVIAFNFDIWLKNINE